MMLVILMLKKRVISAVIGILLLIFLVFSGSLPFFITVSLITILAVREYSRMLKIKTDGLRLLLAAASVYYQIAILFYHMELFYLLLFFVFIFIIYIIMMKKYLLKI